MKPKARTKFQICYVVVIFGLADKYSNTEVRESASNIRYYYFLVDRYIWASSGSRALTIGQEYLNE